VATFLQMVGAVFVGLFIVVVVVVLWLRWKFRKWTSQFTDQIEKFAKQFNPAGMMMASVPPLRIKLAPAEADQVPHTEEFERLTLEIQTLGFQRGALFSMAEIGGVCRGLFHPQRQVDAVIYDHPLLNVWVDFVARYADDTTLTVSNCRQVSVLDRPPGQAARNFPGEQISVLWERFQTEVGSRPLTAISADGFSERFENAYRREMDWRISRGGLTEEEIRRQAATGGDGEVDDDLVEVVQRAWQMRIAQHFDEELRTAFLQGESMSLAEYESTRDRLVFVHDHTCADQLQMYLKSSFDDEEGEDDEEGADDEFDPTTKLRQRCLASSPRKVFRELLEANELAGSYRPVREMTTPIAADVYVASREF
jgi:hypothetical protein